MNALNDRIKEQGGEVLGVNVGALDGDEQNIATAKQILETKGAKYRNIYFDSDSDAGKFALGVTAFPTTYVIDRNLWAALIMTTILTHSKIQLMKLLQWTLKNKTNLDKL